MFVVLDAPPLPSYPGASDAGAGPGHVHPVGHRRVTGADHLHEEPGRESAGQEEQEAAGRHLSHQERGRQSPGSHQMAPAFTSARLSVYLQNNTLLDSPLCTLVEKYCTF